MEGCSAPLVVKFADTQKEKEQKKIQQLQASILSLGPTAASTPSVPSLAANGGGTTVSLGLGPATAAAPTALGQSATTLAANAPLITNPPQPVNPFIGADAMSTSSLQLLQQMQAVGLQQQLLQGLIILLLYYSLLFVTCIYFADPVHVHILNTLCLHIPDNTSGAPWCRLTILPSLTAFSINGRRCRYCT